MKAKGYGFCRLMYVQSVEKSDHSSSEYFFGYVQEKYAGQGVRKNPRFALNAPIFQKMKI
jgi:hypothetical protein